MLKIKTLCCCFLIALVFSSCKKNKEDAVFTFNGVDYALRHGFVFDRGSSSSHYNHDFYIGEEALRPTADGKEVSCTNCAYAYFDLYSPGTSKFKSGIFELIDAGNTADKFHFTSNSGIRIIANGKVNEDYRTTSGTINVKKKSKSKYKLTFDVVVRKYDDATNKFTGEAEQTVSFRVDGRFTYFDQK